jgi:hypothetical protein
MLRLCAVTAGSFLLGILPVWPATPFAYDIPPFTGQRYTDRVPDTLDLAERARLSLNALTRPVDPQRDYSLYFVAAWNQNPPVLRHEAGGDDCPGKFIGPQVLNRGRTRSCCWPLDSSRGPRLWRRPTDTSIMWRTIAAASTGPAGGFWAITTTPLTRASISTSTAFTSRSSSNVA